MKVRCYAIFNQEQEVLAEYANPAHRSFLNYDLNNTLSKIRKTHKIEQLPSSNGVWYCKIA